MTVTGIAHDFNANHVKAVSFFIFDGILINRLGKTRPADIGFELDNRIEQSRVTTNTVVFSCIAGTTERS